MVDIDLLVAVGAPLIAFVIGIVKSVFPIGPVAEMPARGIPLLAMVLSGLWVMLLSASGDVTGLTMVEYSLLTVGLASSAAGIQGITRTYVPGALRLNDRGGDADASRPPSTGGSSSSTYY